MLLKLVLLLVLSLSLLYKSSCSSVYGGGERTSKVVKGLGLARRRLMRVVGDGRAWRASVRQGTAALARCWVVLRWFGGVVGGMGELRTVRLVPAQAADATRGVGGCKVIGDAAILVLEGVIGVGFVLLGLAWIGIGAPAAADIAAGGVSGEDAASSALLAERERVIGGKNGVLGVIGIVVWQLTASKAVSTLVIIVVKRSRCN